MMMMMMMMMMWIHRHAAAEEDEEENKAGPDHLNFRCLLFWRTRGYCLVQQGTMRLIAPSMKSGGLGSLAESMRAKSSSTKFFSRLEVFSGIFKSPGLACLGRLCVIVTQRTGAVPLVCVLRRMNSIVVVRRDVGRPRRW